MKSEPDVYSLDDLNKDQSTAWSGVRNYQARNFMMNDMSPGDRVLFYHSNAEPPGIAGTATITKKAFPDPSQFDKKSEYFEPRASLEKPIWFCVQVGFVEKFKSFIPLDFIKSHSDFSEMLVIKKGQRLSIQPVEKKHFDLITKQGRS